MICLWLCPSLDRTEKLIFFLASFVYSSRSQIFVISAYFNLIANTLSQMFVRGVAEIAECFVSIKRLQKFLEAEEMLQMIANVQSSVTDDVNAITTTNLTANWTTGKEDNVMESSAKDDDAVEEISLQKNVEASVQHDTLDTITVNIRKGSLVGIVGPVGSGKSSFLAGWYFYDKFDFVFKLKSCFWILKRYCVNYQRRVDQLTLSVRFRMRVRSHGYFQHHSDKIFCSVIRLTNDAMTRLFDPVPWTLILRISMAVICC